jgi:hypothetical protein
MVEPPPPPNPPKKKRRPRREEECGFCEGNDQKNKAGEAELMVTCDDCGRSGERTAGYAGYVFTRFSRSPELHGVERNWLRHAFIRVEMRGLQKL